MNLCKHLLVYKSLFEQSSKFRVTGAVVAHRTLNPLVLGSNPRSPIIKNRAVTLRVTALFYLTRLQKKKSDRKALAFLFCN